MNRSEYEDFMDLIDAMVSVLIEESCFRESGLERIKFRKFEEEFIEKHVVEDV